MKRAVLALVVMLALLLVVDRVGAAAAGRAVAADVRMSSGLAQTPDAEVTGFPFLTQAIAGRYDRVEVTATGLPAGDLRVQRLEATLRGVQVPLSEALTGGPERIPVESIDARALVSYDELERRAGDRRLRVEPAGEQVRVTGSVRVLGRTLTAAALSRVEVAGDDLLVTAESYEVGNETVDALLTRALGGRLDLRIPVDALPYGLEVTGTQVRPEGLLVRTSATDAVISRS